MSTSRDLCCLLSVTGGIMYTPSHTNICKFLAYIFSADISPELLKLYSFTKVKVPYLVLVYVFNFDLFEISAAILEKGLSGKSLR